MYIMSNRACSKISLSSKQLRYNRTPTRAVSMIKFLRQSYLFLHQPELVVGVVCFDVDFRKCIEADVQVLVLDVALFLLEHEGHLLVVA